MTRLLAAVLVLIGCMAPVRADTDRAVAAVERGEHAAAAREFRKLAEDGDAEAQLWLGRLYRTGKGVGQDDAEAVRWLRRSSEQGSLAARYELGDLLLSATNDPEIQTKAVAVIGSVARDGYPDAMAGLAGLYATGRGVVANDRLAALWYRRAADAGSGEARYRLGLRLLRGQGVPAAPAAARWWLNLAAEQDRAAAQTALGDLYLTGSGVPPEPKRALRWYRKAAERGHAGALFRLFMLHREGTGVAKDEAKARRLLDRATQAGFGTNATDLAFLARLAATRGFEPILRWVAAEAEAGDAEIQFTLGSMYLRGEGVAEDAAEAARWYRRAADQGHARAQFNLAMLHLRGTGVVADGPSAGRWFLEAARRGDRNAWFNLAAMFRTGIGMAKDPARAARLYRRAAENGHAGAQFNLGRMYRNGIGVDKDRRRAASWFERAAVQGDGHAQLALGRLYAEGDGVERDRMAAMTWLTLAAGRKIEGAMEARRRLAEDMKKRDMKKAARRARDWRPLAVVVAGAKPRKAAERSLYRLPPPADLEQLEAGFDKAARRRIQKRLAQLKHLRRADERKFGAKTRAGIRAYQIVHGYEPTGYLTPEQLWVLGVDREKG